MLDFNIQPGTVSVENERDYILQQIDILFDTVPNEVLGAPYFGTKYDMYLYDLNFSAEDLQTVITADLNQLDLLDWMVSVNVFLLNGSERDIILIQIDLTKENYKANKTYRIE